MSFDIAARLDEGRPAVERAETYVWACYAVGYRHPDLTLHHAQIREYYYSEEGLDLSTLAADRASLLAAVQTADDALNLERTALSHIRTGWIGEPSSVARRFIERHHSSGEHLLNTLRAAAQMCDELRAELWRIVDGKVADAIAIDDRSAASSVAWLAAAQTVVGGGGDSAEATGIVKQQILPYVDSDIRADWVAAMRSAATGIDAAYANAIERMNAVPATYFGIPPHLARLSGPTLNPVEIGRLPHAVHAAPVAFAGTSGPFETSQPAQRPIFNAEQLRPEVQSGLAQMSAGQVGQPMMPAGQSGLPEMSAGQVGQPMMPAALPGQPTMPALPIPQVASPAMGMPTGLTNLDKFVAGFIGQFAEALSDLVDLPEASTVQEGFEGELESADPESSKSKAEHVGSEGGETDESTKTVSQQHDSKTVETEGDSEFVQPDALGQEPLNPDSLESKPLEPDSLKPDSVAPEQSAGIASPSTPAPGETVRPPGSVATNDATPCEIAADELPHVGQ